MVQLLQPTLIAFSLTANIFLLIRLTHLLQLITLTRILLASSLSSFVNSLSPIPAWSISWPVLMLRSQLFTSWIFPLSVLWLGRLIFANYLSVTIIRTEDCCFDFQSNLSDIACLGFLEVTFLIKFRLVNVNISIFSIRLFFFLSASSHWLSVIHRFHSKTKIVITLTILWKKNVLLIINFDFGNIQYIQKFRWM